MTDAGVGRRLGSGPGEARILDRGYRRYEGERRGIASSVRSLVIHSIQRGFGLRRTVWAKILPALSVAIAYVPAIVFIGLIALFGNNPRVTADLPSYGDYYSYIVSAIVVFVAFVAPEVLCTDRRTGMLGIYLASPLSRDTYLAAKLIAIAAVLASVCLGPPLLVLVGFVLQGNGPSGFGDLLLTLARVIAAGVCITLFFTAISVAVASLTDRKAFASAAVILLVLLSGAITSALVEGAGATPWLWTLNVVRIPLELASRIHGEPGGTQLSTAGFWAAWAGWTLAGGLVARVRYQHLQVVR